jgi:hypothetical protein
MNIARVKKVLLALTAFLVVIQFVQPGRTNPYVTVSRSLSAHIPVPGEVQAVVDRACGNCHSNRTVWPWYGKVAPLSWVITDDVNEGRRHMNFDDWEALPNPKEESDRLAGICKETQDRGMPPFSYRLLHPESRLKPNEIAALCSWAQSVNSGASIGSERRSDRSNLEH